MTKTRRSPGAFSLGPLAMSAGAVAALYFARDILIPLAFALTLTLILAPAIAWLRKLHIGRVPSVFLVMLALMCAAGGVGWVMANQLIEVANELPRYRQNIHNKIEALHTPTNGALGRAAASVKELGRELSSPDPITARPVPGERTARRNAPVQTGQPLQVQVLETPASGLAYVCDVVSPFLGPLGTAGIVLIFTVFMLIHREDLRNRLFRLVGLSQMNLMTEALDDATQRVSRYLLMQFLVNASLGILIGVGLYFIGIPYAALWGTIAGLLRIVPYVGTVVAGVLPFTLALAVFDSWIPPLLVFLLFATLELITGNLLEPWLYGAHTGISSLAILVTTVFWTVLWGPAGLILSTPLTVCVVVLGRYAPQLSFLHILLGDEQVLAPEAQLYQRLLAMDQIEARAVVDIFLKDKPLVQLYDSVMIPALGMAEQDRHKGALDADREEFLFLSISEMIAEFSEFAHATRKTEDEDSTLAQGEERAIRAGRVLCVPASDTADEITSAMLAQLLEDLSFAVLSFPAGSALQDLAALQPDATDIICISALPPFAFARARAICKQVRTRYPKIAVVVGVWGFAGDAEEALLRFEPARPNKLLTSVAGAVEYIEALASGGDSDRLAHEARASL
jgi:predicted PurR-regulated permease PerM